MKHIKSFNVMVAVLLVCTALSFQNVTATGVSVFNSIPDPLPGNLPSQPYQAQQAAEFGDHIQLAGTSRNLSSVTVTMSSWARHSEYPNLSEVGFAHPLTLNIYNVDKSGTVPALGSLIASVTQEFVMQWRPEGDPTCPDTGYGAGFAWRAVNGTCYNGFAFNIVFDLSEEGIVLPDEIIYGIASNTETWGYDPIGTPGPYNSLNFAVNNISAPSTGIDVEPDAVFFNTETAAWYADGGAGGVGIFRRDTGWTGYVPAVRFDVEEAVVTPELTVKVQDSLGNPVEGAVITYAVGSPNAGWQTFGTTAADGTISRSDLTVGTNYHFYASYNASTSTSQALVFDGDDEVVFETVLVKAKVETCLGAAIEGAAVTYGSVNGGFLSFGTTGSDGFVSKELFPGYDRTFYASVNHTSSALQTATVVEQGDPLVTFETTKVTINYSGSVNHGSANGGWYPFTKPAMEMFAGARTFLINGTQVAATVPECDFSTGDLTVKFPGIGSVHTYLKKSDGVNGVANGVQVASLTWKNDEAVFADVPNDVYDIVVVKGAQTKIVDNVIVLGDKTVEGLVSTLTVEFPGVGSVHAYAKMPDGIAGVAGGGGVEERTWKNDLAELIVLKGTYDVLVVKGAKNYVVDNVDCTGETCLVNGIVATLTVKFPGIGSVHTYARMPDGGGAVEERTWKNDQSEMVVLKGVYDVSVVKGAKTYIVEDVDCTGNTCLVDGIVATLTVKFPGIGSVHTYAKMPDGAAGVAGGGGVEERTWKNDQSEMVVLKGTYDVQVVKGAKTYVVDNVDCTGTSCQVDGIVATLTVKFPGIGSVHTYAKMPDGVANTAGGGGVEERTWKNDQSEMVVLKGMYDVSVVKGAKTYVADDVDCSGDTCLVEGIVATLTIKYPGMTGIHNYVKIPDAISNSATGGAVEQRTWQNNESVMTVLRGFYDVLIVKGSSSFIYDDVNCTALTCTLDKANLTVKFPGITSVHTYVRKSDNAAGTATGTQVASQTYKTDQAVFADLPNGLYDVIVVKGAQTKIIDNVTVLGGWATVDKIVATLTVKFPGIVGVHTYAKVNDGVVGAAAGGSVEDRTYKTDETSMTVLKSTYDVTVVKGAKQKVIDAVDCTGETCLVENIVATLTVKFPGIAGVHAYAKVNDGVVGTATGGSVEDRTYKTDETSMTVLKSTYDVIVVKGAKQKVIDAVDCTGNTCVVENIVATLTVKFPGIISVHTYAKVDDGVAGTAAGGSVEERTYKNNETSMVVLKGTYDVIVVKGAKQKVVDTVDCTGNTCVVENIVATLTVKFPGLSSVHTYVKVNDGVVGTAAGGSVDERTYKTNEVSIVVLKSTYDVVVIKGSKQVIVDAVDCTGDTCVIENILAALTAKFPASGLFAYNNKERR